MDDTSTSATQLADLFDKIPESAQKHLQHLRITTQSIETPPPVPMWEYTMLYLDFNHCLPALIAAGQDNWEYCTSYPDPLNPLKRFFLCKRPGIKNANGD